MINVPIDVQLPHVSAFKRDVDKQAELIGDQIVMQAILEQADRVKQIKSRSFKTFPAAQGSTLDRAFIDLFKTRVFKPLDDGIRKLLIRRIKRGT